MVDLIGRPGSPWPSTCSGRSSRPSCPGLMTSWPCSSWAAPRRGRWGRCPCHLPVCADFCLHVYICIQDGGCVWRARHMSRSGSFKAPIACSTSSVAFTLMLPAPLRPSLRSLHLVSSSHGSTPPTPALATPLPTLARQAQQQYRSARPFSQRHLPARGPTR